jgi:O-antigen/teichoic acid export membrane protein
VADSPTETSPASGQRFARAAVQTYGTSLATAFVSLANVLVMARALGAEGRGQVAFLTAIAWLVASLATLGVPESNVNLAAGEPKLRRSLATNSVLLAAVLGALSIAALAILIWLFPAVAGESDPALRWLTFAFLPVLILQPCLRYLAQADYAFAITNATYLLPALLNLGVNGLLAVAGGLTVGVAVGTWLAGQLLATAIVAWYIARRLAGFGRPDLALAKRVLGFGAKAHVGRVMQLGNYRLDQWLLGAIAGPRELGLYSVAVAWAEALWYLPTALSAVQRPDLVRARRRDAARAAAAVFRGVVLVTAVLGLVMIVAAPLLCTVLFGPEFSGSVDDLRVLVAGAFGMIALKLFGNALVAQGFPLMQSLAIGAGFALTIVLDVLLIPSYGGLGAAIASTLAYTAAGGVVAVAFVRSLEGRATDLVPRPGDGRALLRRTRELTRRGGRTSEAGSGG